MPIGKNLIRFDVDFTFQSGYIPIAFYTFNLKAINTLHSNLVIFQLHTDGKKHEAV